MKRLLLIIFFLGSTIVQAQDAWTQLNNFPFEAYTGGSFVVNDEAYIIVREGQNPNNFPSSIYKYDVVEDLWEFVIDVITTSSPIENPFVIGDRVFFVGDEGNAYHGIQLWEYDVINNVFVERTGYEFDDFGLYGYTGSSFTIDNTGYIITTATAENGATNFIAYNPDTDSWTAKAPYPSDIVLDTQSYAINGKGYVNFSMDVGAEGTFVNDLWEYDPEADSWTAKTVYPVSYVTGPVSFVLDDMAYFASGFINSFVYRYKPEEDTWESIESPGFFFDRSFGFALNGFGYMGLGNIDSIEGEASDQIWRLDPELLSVSEVTTETVSIFPNPVTDQLFIQSERPIQEVTIYNLVGQTVLQNTLENNQLDVSSLSKGVYLVELNNEDGKLVRKLIKE